MSARFAHAAASHVTVALLQEGYCNLIAGVEDEEDGDRARPEESPAEATPELTPDTEDDEPRSGSDEGPH